MRAFAFSLLLLLTVAATTPPTLHGAEDGPALPSEGVWQGVVEAERLGLREQHRQAAKALEAAGAPVMIMEGAGTRSPAPTARWPWTRCICSFCFGRSPRTRETAALAEVQDAASVYDEMRGWRARLGLEDGERADPIRLETPQPDQAMTLVSGLKTEKRAVVRADAFEGGPRTLAVAP